MYYLLSLAPVFINAVLQPLWYYGNKYGFCSIGKSSGYQGLLNIFIFPIFLIILNIYFITKHEVKWYISILLILLVIVINSALAYFGWGISTGHLLNPDAETIMVVIYINTLLPIIISVLGMGIFGIINLFKK